MHEEFYEELAKENGNLTGLLDKVTYDCEDYFRYNPLLEPGKANISCSETFRPHHYGIGGKCFPSIKFTNLSGRDLQFTLYQKEDVANLSRHFAAKNARRFAGYTVNFMNHENDLYNLDYVDLTPVKNDRYNFIMLTRVEHDHTKENRYIDNHTCVKDLYTSDDCSR